MTRHPADLDSLVSAALMPALVADLSRDRIVAANAAALRVLGRAAPGARLSAHLGSGVARMIVFADEIAHRGEAWTRDLPLFDAAGLERPVELRGRFVDAQTRFLLLYLVDLDDMDRHAHAHEVARLQRAGLFEWQRTQRFFADLERRNQLILNAAGEGIYGLNAEGKTTFVNRAAQEMLGWTADDLLGRDIHSIIHHHHLNGDAYPAHDCPIYHSFRFEKVHRIEDEVFWRKDGKPIRVEYVSTPIYDAQVLAGAVVIFRDITERKENERRLHDALIEVAALRDRLELENAYLQEEITQARAHHDILGLSPAIRQLLTRIDLVARTDAAVLITGEPGTGKSLVASAIHKDSDRRRRPLIAFKCGSVAPDAVETELFGLVRGTGAPRDRPGKLELAHGGTLFLDEVADLPWQVQGLLLEALQSRQVTRGGDTRARDVDLRVIASTARDLEREVAAGRFRADLYFHLSLFPIRCTPLRDRAEDVPVLAQSLLERACARLNRRLPTITSGTMQRLQRYGWPGNVRELSNVMERGAIVSTGEKFVLDLAEARPSDPVAPGVLTEPEMERLQRDNLAAALRQAGGRVAGPGGAAELLRIKPTTCYSRIRALGLAPSDDLGRTVPAAKRTPG